MLPLPAWPKFTMRTLCLADSARSPAISAGIFDTGTAMSSLILFGASLRSAGDRALREAHSAFVSASFEAAFGVPVAHEDDAERAVRAALEIVPRVEELGLSVRIGVESGEIVVEDGDSTFATGEAVNLAARLQQGARPGEILLGPVARRLAASAV